MPEVLVEIKMFQPAKGDAEFQTLSGYSDYPDRYRYTYAWKKTVRNVPHCCIVGGEGWFPFHDNFCPKFLGEYPAIILQEVDKSFAMAADRFAIYDL